MWWRAAHICREGYSNMFVPLLSFFSYFDTLLFIIKKMYVFSLLFKPITDEPDIGKPTQLNWFRKKKWQWMTYPVYRSRRHLLGYCARWAHTIYITKRNFTLFFSAFLPSPASWTAKQFYFSRPWQTPPKKRTITTQFRFLFERVFAIVESLSEIPTKEGHSRQHKSASVSN